jgi:hypothetical protein
MITALIQMYEEGRLDAKWPNPTYTNIMIGTHADSVIRRRLYQGRAGLRRAEAYRAMYRERDGAAGRDGRRQWGIGEPWQGYEARGGLSWYKKLGYNRRECRGIGLVHARVRLRRFLYGADGGGSLEN